MVNWDELYPDMLFMIAKRIEIPEDFASFRSVCTTWRDVALRKGSTVSLQPLQSLMFMPRYIVDTSCKIYSFARDKLFDIYLPEETIRKQIIKTNGWLFLSKSRDNDMILLEPFSRKVIHLPPKTTFGDYFHETKNFCDTKKAVLSSNPSLSPDDYILMIIHGKNNQLGFWKPGDRVWTVIETYNAPFQDLIYSKGQFYAIDEQGIIYLCDVKGDNPTVATSICEIPFYLKKNLTTFHLAECVGNINNHDSKLLIVRKKVSSYKVYEVDLSGKGKFEELKDLGSKTIFMCPNETFCLEHSKFPSGIIKPHKEAYYRYSGSDGKWVGIREISTTFFSLKTRYSWCFVYRVESWSGFPPKLLYYITV